ncbi:MAG: pyridoxine 5'-phosphate synthase [Gammaproteobacteria bacterium]|nr:pyridoxine 5'-phosphate synthase [Gammaproteobacteria bacterium]
MTTNLSVNLNKVALLRNARVGDTPDIEHAARLVLDAGAAGITVHPRPDMRHVRPDDVFRLAELIAKDYPDREFNIEGNPKAGTDSSSYPGYMEIIKEIRPTQATLVPDSDEQLTSDHGWDLPRQAGEIREHVGRLKDWGVRVSLFMDVGAHQDIAAASAAGADRIEVYTGPFAAAHHEGAQALKSALEAYVCISKAAETAGLGINAGHDLSLDNLTRLVSAFPPLEVSIGHALTAEALQYGLPETVRRYLQILNSPRCNK